MIRPLACAALFVGLSLIPAEAASARNGAALAAKNCAPCHSTGKAGASPNEKAPPFRELSGKYPLENLQEALGEGILVGHQSPEMPEFELTPRQIDDLIAHIRAVTSKAPKR